LLAGSACLQHTHSLIQNGDILNFRGAIKPSFSP
jgi:hypothetical protein